MSPGYRTVGKRDSNAEDVESTTMPYTGRLTVEDEAFELTAERFIVRARDADRTDILEVAFQLGGRYDGDAYSSDGVSTHASDGRYVSKTLQVEWAERGGVDEAVVVLTKVEEIRERCQVEGEWHEYGDCYRFSGLLDPFLAQT